MTVIELLARLQELGIDISAENGKLRISAPRGQLDDDLKRTISLHKPELLELLAHGDQESGRPVPQPRGGALPVSYFQERLWVMQRLEPQSTAYNMVAQWRTEDPAVDAARLATAAATVIGRHEVLHATYRDQDGTPAMFALDPALVAVPLQDLRESSSIEQQRILATAIAAAAHTPFDLQVEPPVRCVVYWLADDLAVTLLAAHHIALDAWSLELLGRELAETYRMAERSDRSDSRASETKLQYADYAAWQRQQVASLAIAAELDWWADNLSGAPQLSVFPADRAPSSTTAGALHGFSWDSELSEGIRRLARERGATVYMVLLAACGAVLQVHTGQGDVVFGSPMGVRERPEFESMIGPFVNLLVLRLRLDDDPSTAELVTRARNAMLDAHAHRDVPFERLIERIKPRRSLNHSPVFQMALVQHNATEGPSAATDSGGALHELTWFFREFEGKLHGAFEYRSDLYTPEHIARIAAQLEAFLRGAIADPTRPISRTSLLTPAERALVLQQFNETAVRFDFATVVGRFERWVHTTPDASAVSFDGSTVTYAELDRAANRLARHLRGQGVGPGVLVGLCVDRSCDLIIALLGIQKSGGAYVPLDPGFPPDRLAYMLADSGAKVLVIAGTARGFDIPADVRIVDLGADKLVLEQLDATALRQEIGADDPAYVIYTSGSTGRPKGVVVSHGALSNFIASMKNEPGLVASDILAAVTTISFDIAALELYLPLITGARIELISRQTAADGIELSRQLESRGVTIMQATPTTWRLMIEAGWQGPPGFRALCGGEPLPPDLADSLLTRVKELWNLYGPTETTVWSTCERLEAGRSITVGKPIANTQVYVLNRSLQPVPIGLSGEIWIGGAGVALSYHNQPELTRDRFIPDPFSPAPGARLYRTGDLGRWGADGRLHHLGRLDHQVKIRGFRIELGEIESVLCQHPQVREAVVLAASDNSGEQRLVAYVVANEAGPGVGELREHLKKQVPEYMLPAAFAFIDKLPLTNNGKVDRGALAATSVSAGTLMPDEYVPPVTETEKEVAQVFADVLGISGIVGAHHNFFELGGHSLLATRVLARLRERFRLDIPLMALFQAPTVQGLSRWLDAEVARESAPPLSAAGIDQAPRWKGLVAAQANGSRPPLFLLTGYMDADDTPRILANLMPYLGSDQPLCGLRPRWLDGHSPQYSSVAEMTDEYVAEIRGFQARGPYYLLGDCVGGVVAVEIAQKLMAQGDEVAMLLLLDTERPQYFSPLLNAVARLAERGKHIAELLREWRHPAERTRRQMIADLVQRKLRRAGLGASPMTTTDHVYQHRTSYRRVLKGHRLKRYAGKIELIVTEDVYRFIGLLGWEGFADGGLEIHRTPGDHETVRSQNCRELGLRIRMSIDRAISQRSHQPADGLRARGGRPEGAGAVTAAAR